MLTALRHEVFDWMRRSTRAFMRTPVRSRPCHSHSVVRTSVSNSWCARRSH